MSTRVFTVIETDESEKRDLRFEWHGGRLVNVVTIDGYEELAEIDSFVFRDQPTVEEVVLACERYFDE
jgi:hypothetical protein